MVITQSQTSNMYIGPTESERRTRKCISLILYDMCISMCTCTEKCQNTLKTLIVSF